MASESQPRASASSREEKPASTALKRSAAADRSEGADRDARGRLGDVVGDISRTLDLKGRVDRHPYGTLAAALGIGYLLGGGLFTPLTGRLVNLGLKLGIRLAVVPFLNEEAMSTLGDLLTGQDQGGGPKRRRGRQNGSEEGTP